VTGMIIAAGFAMFGLAVKYLPIFPREVTAAEPSLEPEAEVAVTAAITEHAGD
jgi:hypothetical protein